MVDAVSVGFRHCSPRGVLQDGYAYRGVTLRQIETDRFASPMT
jgi:hypothetical protein